MAKSRQDQSDESHDELRVSGRFAFEGLERLIHERSRLGILSSLAAHPKGLLFNDLKQLCSLAEAEHLRNSAWPADTAAITGWSNPGAEYFDFTFTPGDSSANAVLNTAGTAAGLVAQSMDFGTGDIR